MAANVFSVILIFKLANHAASVILEVLKLLFFFKTNCECVEIIPNVSNTNQRLNSFSWMKQDRVAHFAAAESRKKIKTVDF